MKKILALFLAVLMVFTALSACGTTPQQEEESNDTEDQVERQYRDFYEQEFWAAYFIGSDHFCFFWPEPTTTDKERTRKIAEETQQALNCVLLEEGMTNMSANTWATKMATADYQFTWAPVQSDFSPIENMYNAGFIQSWNDIPGVDLTDVEKWGSPTVQQTVLFDGEVYAAVSGDRGGHFGRLFYNKLLAQELNPTVLPQDMYEQGTWTWENFETYLESVTVHDADRDVYGLVVLNDETTLAYCSVFSNGGEFVNIAEDGTATFGLNDPEALEALDWAAKLVQGDTVKIDNVWPPVTWAKEGAVIELGDGSVGTASSGSSAVWGLDNLDDIRCIPFPRGPKGDGSVGGAFSTSGAGQVILFGNDKEDAGYVWSIKTDISLKYNEDTEEEWKRKTFFQDGPDDNDSYNNWVFIAENFNLDYASQMGSATKNLKSAMASVLAGSATSAQAMAGIQGLVQAELDKTMNGK